MGCVLVLGLQLTSVARAAWHPPVDVSNPGEHIGTPHVVLDSAGNATAVWDRWDGNDTVVESSFRPAGGGWQPATNLSGVRDADDDAPLGAYNAQSARIAVDGDGDTTVIWERYADVNRILIQSVYRPVGGSWQAPVDIGEVKTMVSPEPWIAVDVEGNATAVWKSGEVIQSAYKPAGGSWGAPAPISGSDSYVPQAAVDAQGDATAVWMHFDGADYVVESAYRPAGGSWEAPLVVSAPGEEAGNPHIALDADGDAMVVWRGESGGEEVLRSASRPAGGDWQAPVDVSTPGEAVQSPRVALDPDGNAIVAWSGSSSEVGAYGIAKAAFQPAAGSWEAPVELSEAGGNAFPLDLVFDSSGNAALAWMRFNGSHHILQAAYRPAEASWEEATDLSEEGSDAIDAVLVLDAPGIATAAEGVATAVWTRVDSVGCAEKPACASSVVQAAGYDVNDPAPEKLEVPVSAEAGAPVEISVPSEDIWAPLLDFGDGESTASASATHTYSEPGEYKVTFASNNVLGYRSSAERKIVVGPGNGSLPPDEDPAGAPSLAPAGGTGGAGGIDAGDSPSQLPSPACLAARRSLTLARGRLKARQAKLGRGEAGVADRARRRMLQAQIATLRKARRRASEACG